QRGEVAVQIGPLNGTGCGVVQPPDAAVIAVDQPAGSIEDQAVVIGVDAVGAAGPGANVGPGGATVCSLNEAVAAAIVRSARINDIGVARVNRDGIVVPTLAVHVIGGGGQLGPGGSAVGALFHLEQGAERCTAGLSGAGNGGIEHQAIGLGNSDLDVA